MYRYVYRHPYMDIYIYICVHTYTGKKIHSAFLLSPLDSLPFLDNCLVQFAFFPTNENIILVMIISDVIVALLI